MNLELCDIHQQGGSAVFGEQERCETYKGAERRRVYRRENRDRRVEMRFEMEKPDRREKTGRRTDDKVVNFW